MVNQQFATAVHVMVSLALQEGQTLSSSELAESVNTNAVVIRRILSQLQKAGLVTTSKGKNGGVMLKKCPPQVSLLDIFKAVQKRQLIAAADRHVRKTCPVSRSMVGAMCGIARGVEEATESYLKKVTLESLKKKIA
jgi:Rrf2 family protein